MRGSWNRKQPSGYEVARIRFEDGRPVAIEPFLTGFLTEQDGEPAHFGRPTGLAVAADGALLVADDTNGVIYRVSYDGPRDGQPKTAAGPQRQRGATASAGVSTPSRERTLSLLAGNGVKRLDVSSPAIGGGDAIPREHAEKGQGVSPPISWSGAPDGAQSFVLIMEDPDATAPKPFVHWLVYNIPADRRQLHEGLPAQPRLLEPEGVLQGRNSRGSVGYYGMNPPPGDGAHDYHFQVFALDTALDLPPGASWDRLSQAMKGHVVAAGELVGRYEQTSRQAD